MEVDNPNIIEKDGIVLARSAVEVGKTYPVYGMITAILDESLPSDGSSGSLLIELNKSIRAHLKIRSESHLKEVKERLFESGIFVGQVLETSPQVEIDCKTVIFGKKRTFDC